MKWKLPLLVASALVNLLLGWHRQHHPGTRAQGRLVLVAPPSAEPTVKIRGVEGPELPFQIQLRNEGSGEALIQRVTTSCECMDLSLAEMEVAPGGVATVRGLYHTQGHVGFGLKTITIESDAGVFSIRLDVSIAESKPR